MELGGGGGEQRHCWGRNIGTKARDRGTDLKKGREELVRKPLYRGEYGVGT